MSPETLHATLARHNLPPSFSSPSFRRLVRPGGAPSRRGGSRDGPDAAALGDAPRQRRPRRRPDPDRARPRHADGARPAGEQDAADEDLRHLRYRDAASAVRDYVNRFFGLPPIESRPTFEFDASLQQTLVARLDPQQTAPPRFYARVSAAAGGVAPPRRRARASSSRRASRSRCTSRCATSRRSCLLPGVGTIDADTVTLLKDNPRFIEAYMIGLNHELARELLWREFPSDMRGTTSAASGTRAARRRRCAAAGDPHLGSGDRARQELRRGRRRTSSCSSAASCCTATRTR